MNIVVAARCLNESDNIERFVRGYDFADHIVISDGGSTDDSVSKLSKYRKVHVIPFDEFEMHNGHRWNPDNLHIRHSIDEAMKFDPTWLIMDDMDCVPNRILRLGARDILEQCAVYPQVNAFRLICGEVMNISQK